MDVERPVRLQEESCHAAGLFVGVQQALTARSQDFVAVGGLEAGERLKKLHSLAYDQFLVLRKVYQNC